MPGQTQIFTSIPDQLIELVSDRLPTSITLLRRLQFAVRENGATANTRIIVASDTGNLGDGTLKPRIFTAVHADLSPRAPISLFMYSTLEDKSREMIAGDREEHEAQVSEVVNALIRLRSQFDPEGNYPTSVLLGSVHEDVGAILIKLGRVLPQHLYEKWLFRVQDIPPTDLQLPRGMHWGSATAADCKLAVSRSNIPRTAYETTPFETMRES
ncbi:hypothetical protein DCS_02248 [Drechmeria coniospora]|uniref:Uncharacterized protein n=1 Tax=Drechmeria coniospora TaxID=98403 RepID=A0A151GVG4_DRECN|nr:hypothetical protein DCS_02248 [Drechmeria coniospora]KYK61107.1 hypothetical protein DCS_02248 [Drechmeria coniospora]